MSEEGDYEGGGKGAGGSGAQIVLLLYIGG